MLIYQVLATEAILVSGFACILSIMSGYRMVIYNALILLLALWASNYATANVLLIINSAILIFYTFTLLLLFITGILFKLRRHTAAVLCARAFQVLYPFTGVENFAKSIQASICLLEGKIDEANMLFRETLNNKTDPFKVVELTLRTTERDYNGIIALHAEKKSKFFTVAGASLIKAYCETGRFEEALASVKPYIDYMGLNTGFDREALLVLAAFGGQQDMFEYAVKKIRGGFSPCEKYYYQSTLNYCLNGSIGEYRSAFNSAPPALTSKDKIALEDWQEHISDNRPPTVPSEETKIELSHLWLRLEKVDRFLWGNYRQLPWVSISLCLITLVLSVIANQSSSDSVLRDVRMGALVYPYSLNLGNSWRFVSACFVNPSLTGVLACFLYGVWVERAIGSKAYIGIFLLSGIGAYFSLFLLYPVTPNVPPFALFGAIPALLGIFATMFGYSLKTLLEEERFFIACGGIGLAVLLSASLFLIGSYLYPASSLTNILGFVIGFVLFMCGDLFSKTGKKRFKEKLGLTFLLSAILLFGAYLVKLPKDLRQSAYKLEAGSQLSRLFGKMKDAHHWHQKSIQLANSDPEQQGELGFNYLYENGLSKNKVKGLYLLEQSALRGSKPSAAALSEYYWRGKETPRDSVKGFYWSQRAANQNNGEAQKRLGDAYFHGWGTSKDLKQAYAWYSRALKSSDAEFLDQFEIKATMRTIKAKL